MNEVERLLKIDKLDLIEFIGELKFYWDFCLLCVSRMFRVNRRYGWLNRQEGVTLESR